MKEVSDSLPFVLTFPYDDVIKARARTLFLNQALSNSHRGVDARIIGAIGEAAFEIACERIGIPFARIGGESTVADYKLQNGALLEVKTKERSVRPRQGFEASRPQYNEEHQKVDYYVFASVWNPSKTRHAFVEVAVLGAISSSDFDRVSYEVKIGTKLGSGRGAWTAMRNIRIEELGDLKVVLGDG
jgi:hypothetical protein